MTTYRFLWLDVLGHPVKSKHIECATERQAIDIAEHQTGKFDVIEVWDGDRMVSRMPHVGNSATKD